MKIKIKSGKNISKHKIVSNKALNQHSSSIAYKGDNHYITIPFIDKIVICGTPPNVSKEQLNTFIKYLRQECEYKKSGENLDSPLDYLHFKNQKKTNYWRKYYTDTFKITLPGSNNFISFYIGWTKNNPGQRLIRMEFNPWKLKRKGIEFFINWYDATCAATIGTCFHDIISVQKCINRLDIAADIVGIHISDLIFNLEEQKKESVRWHSGLGLLETYYFDAKIGKNSKLLAYNKAKEMKDESVYGRGIPVTRVEAKVYRPIHPVTGLDQLFNKFNKIEIYHLRNLKPTFLKLIPEERHNLNLFLDSVRSRGMKDALKRLPRHLEARYATLLTHGLENIFEGYNDSKQWQGHWASSIRQSGLLFSPLKGQ